MLGNEMSHHDCSQAKYLRTTAIGWGLMDSLDRVANALVGSRGKAYCDACLASNLMLERWQQVREVTTALAGSASFRRRFGICAACGRERIVIGSH